jgi:hypothetical protein
LLPESVTFAVKDAEPLVVGVPEMTPAVERLRPYVARLLEVAVQVYPEPVPPAAARVWEYVVPTVPAGKLDVVTVNEARTVTEIVAVAVWL